MYHRGDLRGSQGAGARRSLLGRDGLRSWSGLRLSRWETEQGEKRQTFQVDVDEVGPSLRFAQAKVAKMTRTRAGSDGFIPADAPDDAWSTATPPTARQVA